MADVNRRVAVFGYIPETAALLDLVAPMADLAALITPANRVPDAALVGKATSRGVPVFVQPRRDWAGGEGFLASLRESRADLFLVFSYSLILDARILGLPRLGAVNLHSGKLPEYRGGNPVNWAIINGETEAGVTLHWLDTGIDTGPVIARRTVGIGFRDTALDLKNRLLESGFDLLREHLPGILAGSAPAIPQAEGSARTWPRRRPEDGVIDWRRPTLEIYNLIRGLVRPWPGAWFIDANGSKRVVDEFLELDQVDRLRAEMMDKPADRPKQTPEGN